MQDIGISDLKRLTHVIKEKYCYDFSNYATVSFKRRIMRIMELQRLSNLDVLIKRISENDFRKEDFLSEVTVNVTEMFRDPSFWKVMKQTLPSFITGSNREQITLWHAGCSSGEEVYSMLILLKELGLLHKVKIIASDIDKKILANAKQGKIASKNMELNNTNYIKFGGKSLFDYFTPSNTQAVFDPKLLDMVTFLEIDLTKMENFPKVDIILCRNVLIYFNQTLKNDVLNCMHANLSPNGLLAIGSKETLSWTDVAVKFLPLNAEEKVYKKLKD